MGYDFLELSRQSLSHKYKSTESGTFLSSQTGTSAKSSYLADVGG